MCDAAHVLTVVARTRARGADLRPNFRDAWVGAASVRHTAGQGDESPRQHETESQVPHVKPLL
jgi:hypothetical protein